MDSDPVFPKCVVCSTSFSYRGPQPHLLPCLHPVCAECLKAPKVTTLGCSVCLKSHDKNVGSFPEDSVVLGDVLSQTMKHRPSDFQCTNKMDGNQAMYWCQDCEEYFCEHCHISHSEVKATRNHTVKWISDLPCSSRRSQSICQKHGQRLGVYDKDCDCFICFECCYEDHARHGTDRADLFLSREHDVLRAYLKFVSEKKEKIISAKETVLVQATRIEEKAVSLRDAVQQTFSELRDVIDQREKEVLVELDQTLDAMRKINDSRLPVLESSETCCRTIFDYINATILYASPSHLHKVKNSITQAFESCIEADVPCVHKNEPCVDFSKQGFPDLKSFVSSFGGFMTSVIPSESPMEASLKTGLQMKLEADIDELQTQNRAAQTLISTLEKKASKNELKVKTLEKDVSRLQGIVIQLDPMGNNKDTWLHVLGTVNGARHVVVCPKMKFDSDRVNLDRTHINVQGHLINTHYDKWRTMKTLDISGEMSMKYHGTCSTSPLPSSGLVYWEVEADVELDKPLDDRLLVLEIGVCTEDVIDSNHYIGNEPHSCSLRISGMENYVRTFIAINGECIVTFNVFDNRAGTSVTLMYGVLVDTDTMAVSFLDTTNRKVLASGCIADKLQRGVGYSREMWPVFAVCSGPKRVEMKLVSGPDLQMEDWKKKLLEDARQMCAEGNRYHSYNRSFLSQHWMDSEPVFPKCTVCSTSFSYRGPQPYLLPCLNPVCGDCLKSPEVTSMACSVCLKSHDKNVGSFPVDDGVWGYVLNQTMKHQPSNFQCTNKMDGNQAMSWCQECEDYFCEHCHISHTEVKATRNHTMKWISDLPCTPKRPQSICQTHRQRLDVYDKDCDCFICFQCLYEDHASHGTDTADMFLSREQDVLKAYLKSASEKKEKIISAKEKVLAQARCIDEKAVSLRDAVQHTFSELRDVIDQKEKEVLVALDQTLDAMRKINDSRPRVLESLETSCQSVLNYINDTLLYASPSHLHKLKSSITQAFESCIKADVPVVHKYEPCVVFSKQGFPDLKSFVSSFGGFLTSVIPTETPMEASLKTGLQMKLEADIDELQTQIRDAQSLISTLEQEASKNEQKLKTLQEDVSRLQAIVIQFDKFLQ